MSVLTQWRVDVSTALSLAGLNAHTTVPERPAPPLTFVGPGDPYLAAEEGYAFGAEVLRLDVVLVASRGVNDVKAAELDDMIETALDALEPLALLVRRVDRPGQITLANQNYLAVTIAIEVEVFRNE